MVNKEFSPEVRRHLLKKTPSSKEIFELIKRYKKLKAGRAKERLRDEILMINSKLVASIAAKLAYHSKTSKEDFFQSGMMGLMRSLDLFEFKRGCAFSTYATPWIVQAMRIEKLQETPVMVTRGMRQSVSKFMKKGNGSMDFSSRSESERNAQAALLAMSEKTYLSLDDPIKPDHDSGDDGIYLQIPDSIDYEEKVFSSLLRENVARDMPKILKPKEVIVIRELHFKEAPSTLEDIAKTLGRGVRTVRKLEERALHKLRKHFRRSELIIPTSVDRNK